MLYLLSRGYKDLTRDSATQSSRAYTLVVDEAHCYLYDKNEKRMAKSNRKLRTDAIGRGKRGP